MQKYDLHFISTGDVLRREIMNKTKVGKEAEAIVAAGGEPRAVSTPSGMHTDEGFPG